MSTLSLIDKTFALKKISLFADLDLDLLLPIADKLHITAVPKGETIFTPDQPGHRMYLVQAGSVRLVNREDKTVGLLNQWDYFGDESLFNDLPRDYGAISETAATLLTLSRTDLLSIIQEAPTVAIALLEAYSTAVPFRFRTQPLS